MFDNTAPAPQGDERSDSPDPMQLWEQGQQGDDAADAASDPLADLPEEYRDQAQQAVQAARETAARETEQRYRSALGKWGNAANQLNQIGLTVDESGRVAAHDPQALGRAAQFFGGAPQPQAQQSAPQETAPTAPAEEEITDWDTPQEVARKTEARFARQVQRAVQEATAPLLQQVAALQGQVVDATAPTVMRQAVPHLQAMGLEWAAEDPQYQAAFRSAVGQIPAQNRQDPEAIRLAAFAALGIAQAQGMQRQQQQPPEAPRQQASPGVDPRQAAAAVSQANLSGYGAVAPARSAGRAPAPAAPPQYIQTYLDAQRQLGIDLGMDAEELAAAMATPDARTGHSDYVDYMQRRGARNGGRR